MSDILAFLICEKKILRGKIYIFSCVYNKPREELYLTNGKNNFPSFIPNQMHFGIV